MSMQAQEKRMREAAKNLLESEGAAAVLGFAEGPALGLAVPVFITDPAEADRLVWNERCVPNLAGYLIGREGKTAIVAKPCDVRAIVNLTLENQVKRGDVYIIGMDCPGMRDEGGDELRACGECRVNTPPVSNLRVENPDVAAKAPKNEKAEKGLDESFARFCAELDKCILCYSCRQACYGCYCGTCFMDRGVPTWQALSPDRGTKMLYHLGRAMHLAGRCVECGACENACASGVDVRYLIHEVTDFVDELYGFRTGVDFDAPLAMQTYKPNDAEVGFLGGDAHG